MKEKNELSNEYFEELNVKGLPNIVYRSQMSVSLFGGGGAESIIPSWHSCGITQVVCLLLQGEMK
jgi:hypothetical protein